MPPEESGQRVRRRASRAAAQRSRRMRVRSLDGRITRRDRHAGV
jgi:hypothetical protein